jgi:LysM repeat protein
MNLRKELAGGIIALILSAWIVLGSFSLAYTRKTQIAVNATSTPTKQTTNPPTPQPTITVPSPLPGTASATSIPTPSPTNTATLVPPTSCPPPTDWIAYKTRSGDSLDSLAVKYKTTIDKIMQINCMSVKSLIPAMIIYLPAPSSSATPTAAPSATRTPISCGPPRGWTTYTVRSGDTLYHLAWAYNVTISQLQSANCMNGSDLLIAGRQIYVPNVATRTVSPTFRPPTSTNRPPTRTPLPPTALPTATPTPMPPTEIPSATHTNTPTTTLTPTFSSAP